MIRYGSPAASNKLMKNVSKSIKLQKNGTTPSDTTFTRKPVKEVIGSEYWRRVETRLWPAIIDKMEGQHRAFQLLEGASLQRPYPLTLLQALGRPRPSPCWKATWPSPWWASGRHFQMFQIGKHFHELKQSTGVDFEDQVQFLCSKRGAL